MTCTSHLPTEGRMVQLIDGRTVCSCSDEWRHETECRWALEKLDLRQRREYLDQVRAKRGTRSRARMEGTMTLLWDARKAA